MTDHWVSTYGSVEIEKDQITLIIPAETQINKDLPVTTPSIPYAIVRSNIEFEQGIINFEVKLFDSESTCVIGMAAGLNTEFYGGINILGAPYGFAAYKNNKWEPAGGVGFGTNLKSDHWYAVKIQTYGSTMDLYIDSVLVHSVTYNVTRGFLNLYLQGKGSVSVRKIQVDTQKPICFVVMQFTEEYNILFKEVIKPTCEIYGYKVVRADDFYTSGLIIDDITRSIKECNLVIADITPDNLNVFYEVGYSHGIGKPTILLSDRKREKLPFDLSPFRTLFYDNTIGGKSIVEERLRKHLAAITKSQI
ncbi:hypothetical protein [Nitrosomonas sp.]|uniref:hypothetical protein n=1 Tax=Nitrosomonas sp. TaxID=42353 RepID=UPI00271D0924|nr:hypothetical protein [Nitrosomonas sp.]MDO8894166.1 hypothetical protein [Nitrosomonas sp.]MDP2224926.1 hypothetical protein [Nitrosomonas sp.]